jgi:hypothetical protein
VKRRIRAYIIVVVAFIAAYGAIIYSSAEVSALIWHARHGFHAELGGIRVRVPLGYEASDAAGPTSLLIIKQPGHLQRGGASIEVDFQKLPSPEAMRAAEAMVPKRAVTNKKVGERTATFAGRSGTCVEYVPEFVDPRINNLIREGDGREIDCRFGDVAVTLIGTANLKDDFYDIIQTAEPVRRKS